MLRIDEPIAAAIRAHGAAAYPHECCGALLGVDGGGGREVGALLALANQHESSPGNRFIITAADVRRAEQAARARGLEVIGWYHSHPDHPPLPSEFDRQHAWPWYSYIIVGVAQGAAGAIASWRLTSDRLRFTPEPLEVIVGTGREQGCLK
jgi:proteasome lid subunit RPN8/RPN11